MKCLRNLIFIIPEMSDELDYRASAEKLRESRAEKYFFAQAVYHFSNVTTLYC